MASIYTDIELRFIEASKAPYGSDEHRILMLVLAECFDLIPGEHDLQAVQVARDFDLGGARPAFAATFAKQRAVDHIDDKATYLVLDAALDMMQAMMNPLGGLNAIGSLRGAYIAVMNIGSSVSPGSVSAFRRDSALVTAFDEKAKAILDRHIPV